MKLPITETSDASFSRLIHDRFDGAIDREASQKLEELTTTLNQECIVREGVTLKGEITLTIKFSATRVGKRDTVATDLSYSLKHKLPEPARPTEVLYVDKKGALVTDEPRQLKLTEDIMSSKPKDDNL